MEFLEGRSPCVALTKQEVVFAINEYLERHGIKTSTSYIDIANDGSAKAYRCEPTPKLKELSSFLIGEVGVDYIRGRVVFESYYPIPDVHGVKWASISWALDDHRTTKWVRDNVVLGSPKPDAPPTITHRTVNGEPVSNMAWLSLIEYDKLWRKVFVDGVQH